MEDEEDQSKPENTSKTHSETKKTEHKIKLTGQKSKPKLQIKDTKSSHDQHKASKLPSTSVPIEKPSEDPQLTVETVPPPTEPTPIKPSIEPPKPTSRSPIREESNPTFAPVDLDNDYIEPESPTGIDALLYDDDDDTHSRPLTIPQQPESPSDNNEYLSPAQQQPIRDDYKPKTDTSAM
jgi:hypothetical protein